MKVNKYFKNELDIYRKETNDLFYSLSRILLALGVLVLTISPALLSEDIEGVFLSIAYVTSMLFALVSVFCGVAQYYRDFSEFNQYSKYLSLLAYSKKESEWTKKEKELVEKYSQIAKESRSYNTGKVWLFAQLFFVTASLSLIFLVSLRIII